MKPKLVRQVGSFFNLFPPARLWNSAPNPSLPLRPMPPRPKLPTGCSSRAAGPPWEPTMPPSGASARAAAASRIKPKSIWPGRRSNAPARAASFPASTGWRCCCCALRTPACLPPRRRPPGSPTGSAPAPSGCRKKKKSSANKPPAPPPNPAPPPSKARSSAGPKWPPARRSCSRGCSTNWRAGWAAWGRKAAQPGKRWRRGWSMPKRPAWASA